MSGEEALAGPVRKHLPRRVWTQRNTYSPTFPGTQGWVAPQKPDHVGSSKSY